MRPRHPYAVAAIWCVAFVALVPALRAQEVITPRHTGVPQDWSQRNVVFSRKGLAEHPDVMNREVRVLHQAMQRWAVPEFGVFKTANPLPIPPRKSIIRRDWNVSMGGRLVPNAFPAKFSIDPSAPPDCVNDYAVFGLGVPGTPGSAVAPANLVAFNNLYSGTNPTGLCGLPLPTVLFAYNITTVTGGRIRTSPILSLDGTKIAFVESIPANASLGITAQAIFHVLTWAAGGTISNPVVPSMISLPLISSPMAPTANDFTSSPFIDYGADTVYVGTDDGLVYKITGVFNGVPTLATDVWPVLLTPGHLTPPVLDSVRGQLMVGAVNGNLYKINTSTGKSETVVVGTGFSSGIVAPPIVDVTNGTTFVITADDGVSGAVLAEVDTATMGIISTAHIGVGAFGGSTAINLYQPAFDHNYYNDPSTGHIHTCGTGSADTSPWHYSFGFTGHTMQTSGTSQQLLASTAARCTGWTEFFNPSAGTTGSDFFFFGLTQDCFPPNTGTAFGCLEVLSSDPTIPAAFAQLTTGPRGIVIDNNSAAPQASSIYTTAGGLNTAYKFTQNGLQ
ncbi:MAG: hypothetical protein LAO30_16940 [Acidobacteriia bacterium]|nr:hypothetical protein [Terriglobia bacterium]